MQEKERNSCRMMILCSRELRVSFCPWNTVLCSHSYRVLSVYVCFDLELFRTTWPILSFSLYRFLLCSLSHGSLLWFTRSHMGFHRWTRCATSVFCLFKGIMYLPWVQKTMPPRIKKAPRGEPASTGGRGGIWTLVPLLTATRFPVVLVMTTSIPLHIKCCRNSTVYYTKNLRLVKRKAQKNR